MRSRSPWQTVRIAFSPSHSVSINLATILLTLLMGAAPALSAPGDPGCEFDFNNDGTVTQADLDYCMGLLQLIPPGYDPVCDTDGNGSLTTSDFTPILLAIQNNLDCTAPVPTSSSWFSVLSLLALLLVAATPFVVGVTSGRSNRGGRAA